MSKKRLINSSISIICILASFIIPRIGIWKFFMFPLIYSDGLHYFNVVYQLNIGNIPSFDFIGAGYPLFIYLTRLLYDSANSIIIFQQLLSLASVSFLVYTFRNKQAYFIAASLFACVYLMSDYVVKYEIAVFPDSIISNLLLLSSALFYQTLTSHKKRNVILLGLVAVFLISIRSSSVFMIVIILLSTLYLMYQKKYLKAKILATSFIGGLLILSSYNFFFSEGNKFNFLTYERLEKKAYRDFMKIDNSSQEKSYIKKIYKSLPDTSDIWKYYFSWNANEITTSTINTRGGIYASMINTDTITICNNGDGGYTQCLQVYNQWKNNISSKKLVEIINNNPKYDDLFVRKKLRSLYAFHGNIWLNYDQGYYSMVPAAYKTSQKNINYFTRKQAQSEKEDAFLQYAWKEHYKHTDTVGFEKRYASLINYVPFKIYDVYNEYIAKKLIRTPFTLILTLCALCVYLVLFIRKKYTATHIFLLYTGIILLGSSLTFTLFSNPLPRYSFNTEFCYYLLSIFFLTDCIRFLYNTYIAKK
ncbi:MAG: hypothetical protein R6U95_04555 [Bacteroidales bacterium]